jgi:uncharacterized membrane-anchored protein YjiN (DUF445 family)
MARENNNKPWQDGKYLPEELFDAFTKKFESESDLKKFIVDNIVEFSKDESYTTKLETIKESVKGSKEVTGEVIVEKVEKSKSDFSHLI